MRKRRARRKAIGPRATILVEARSNARWSLDFGHDQFGCRRRFCILNVVDDVTREYLAAIPDPSISGRRMARDLTVLIDFAAINAVCLARLPSLLAHWLPNGRQQGREWVALNPTRADRRADSFRINPDKGFWVDFATAHRGSDAISLFA